MRDPRRGSLVAASVLGSSALNPAFATIASVPKRLMMRGIGSISPQQSESCDATTCRGTLRLNPYVGMPEESLMGTPAQMVTCGR